MHVTAPVLKTRRIVSDVGNVLGSIRLKIRKKAAAR